MTVQRPLVLASASPRRRELLTTLGLTFDVRALDVDESVRAGEPASDYVRRMATDKLRAGLEVEREAFVLASDTVVVLEETILGKPVDAEEARATLTRLAGHAHDVRTAIAIGRAGAVLGVDEVITRVVFRPLSAGEIERYVATGEGDDKAGAYGIQGRAGAFVTRIEGSYSNVVGLPLAETLALLAAHGAVEVWP